LGRTDVGPAGSEQALGGCCSARSDRDLNLFCTPRDKRAGSRTKTMSMTLVPIERARPGALGLR